MSKTSMNTLVYLDRIYPNILSKRDSSSSLAEDDMLEADDSLINKAAIQEPSSFFFEGVRFTPRVIEFNDAFEGKQFFQKIKLQNVGRKPALVKIGEPSSFIFHMNKHDRCVRLLSSGRSITRTLSYVYHNDDIVQRSQIRVQVNGRTIDYPIVVRRAVPAIEVQPPELDFKVINMGASAKTLKITITNTGGKGTRFAIDLGRNELDLVVNPPRGTIRAKSQMNIFVEMVGITEGEFYKELWITTNERPIRVPVIAEVMRPRLEVHHPNATGDFTLIDFPPTFFGTQRSDSIILRNFSADMTPFVILAEVRGELKNIKEAMKLQPSFRMFKMSENEGRLEPFESRIITIAFKPLKLPEKKGWHHKLADEKRKSATTEFLAFYRVKRVHCLEGTELEKTEAEQKLKKSILSQWESEKKKSIMMSVASVMAIPFFGVNDVESSVRKVSGELTQFSVSDAPIPVEDKDVVRLCFHGEATEPDVLVQPDCLHFADVAIGKTEAKVLKLTNQSLTPFKFKFVKIVNFKINPMEKWLNAKEAIEVEVLHTPTFPGDKKNVLKIEIFGKSAELFDSETNVVNVKTVEVRFSAVVAASKISPTSNIDTSIPQMANNRVGKVSGLMANRGVLKTSQKKSMPEGMIEGTTQSRNVALVGLANGHHHSRHWPADRTYKTILTYYNRYLPSTDATYMLTAEEMYRKKMNQIMWNEYIGKMREARNRKRSKPVEDSFDESFIINSLKFDGAGGKCLDQLKYFEKNKPNVPNFVFIPLSPVFLCNIKVEPKLIDFAMVAPNSSVSEILKLHNMNPFPVCVRFKPGKSGVTLPDGDVRIVPPMTKKLLKIVFQTKNLGRYNGFLDYVINGSHAFKITVSANVVPKTLTIPDSEHSIEFGDFEASAAFQPSSKSVTLTNNLRSSIKFHWEMQGDSAFDIEPSSGEVPPMASLMNAIYFKLHPEKSLLAEANLISESGTIQSIKLTYRGSKINAYFSTSKIELKEIPLNLVEVVRPTIKNRNYHDVAFEVLDTSPMPGVKIFPRFGIIKARCSFDLDVEIQIPVVISFQFEVKVRVQHATILSLKISGSVVCPKVNITPMEITMRRVSAQSFDVASMCVENAGTTPAHIDINFKEYPEYRISRSKGNDVDDLEEVGIFLHPGKSSKFFLHFDPTDVARYQFYLPVVINGILGPPMMQDSASELFSYYLEKYEGPYLRYGEVTRSADLKVKIPSACINCTVTGHMLKFSTLQVEFRKNFYCHSKIQEEDIEITNLHVSPLTICLRTDEVNNKLTPFNLKAICKKTEIHSKSIKIHLQVGETATLKAQFTPFKAGEYSAEIPIFVKGYNDGYAYNFLILKGKSEKPKVYAEVKEIHFPPLPLNVGTEVVIQVFAQQYTSPDNVNCAVWGAEEYGKLISETVKVVWLDEPKITGHQERHVFTVQILFKSSYPVSLRTFLIFSDTSGEYFPVLLTAVSDNSSITNHLFVSTRPNKYKLITENEKILNEEPYVALKRYRDTSGGILEARNLRQRTEFASNTKTDFGPKLVIQMTKSMQRLTQLKFVGIRKTNESKKKESYIANLPSTILVTSHADLSSNSTKSSIKTPKGIFDVATEVSYPYFPNGEDNSYYEKYLMETLRYVELWVYEVGFHCEEYLTIPEGFQMVFPEEEPNPKPRRDQRLGPTRKTIVDLVVELAGPKARLFFPDKPIPPKDSPTRIEYLYSTFNCLLRFLNVQGSFLPHVKPEFLLCYKDYVKYITKHASCEALRCTAGFSVINDKHRVSASSASGGSKSEKDLAADVSVGTLNESWNKIPYDEYEDDSFDSQDKKNAEIDETESEAGRRVLSSENHKDFLFKGDQMNEETFQLRSTQAWLDVLLQIFRTLALPKILPRRVLTPGVQEVDEKFSLDTENVSSYSTGDVINRRLNSVPEVENFESNIYTTHERTLLSWLNHHYELQRLNLWSRTTPLSRRVSNFRTDLSDSLVLMAVTASHCPYLTPNYFLEVFPVPENDEQIYHNAIKLTNAWKEVNIGLTVEAKDIVQSNAVFMLMTVCHLYEVLPLLCPRLLIRFSAPLTQEMVKTVDLINEFEGKIIYKAKFIGNQEGTFRLVSNPTMRLKKTADFKIAYRARRINKVSVTLLLDGASVSPHFAKSIVFQLEGEPSHFTDYKKIKLEAELYKVICLDIPITPPYQGKADYEISYSTVSPNDPETKFNAMKLWREIWNRRISRRLFINQTTLSYDGKTPATLNVTIGCLTTGTRRFWLLLRSDVGDFIIRIDVLAVPKDATYGPTSVVLPKECSMECTCTDADGGLNDSDSSTCPLVCYLRIPARNYFLWDTMFVMFQKTLDSKERPFWKQHFETNIGIRLIKWLLSQEESQEVLDEFIPALQTNVTYSLKLDAKAEKYVRVEPVLEIPDVRAREPVYLPIHVSADAPNDLKATLTMTSESKKEIRTIKFVLRTVEDVQISRQRLRQPLSISN